MGSKAYDRRCRNLLADEFLPVVGVFSLTPMIPVSLHLSLYEQAVMLEYITP